MSDRQRDAFEQLVVRGDLTRDHNFQEGYDYSTDLKQALREADKPIAATSKRKNSQPFLSTAEVLQAVERKALEIIRDKTIPTTQRLIHLRAYAGQHPHGLKDADLKRILWDARRSLCPSAAPVEQGQKLSRAEAPWLWEGVVIQGTTNLIVALPKVGKSRLVCQLIGALARSDSHFLGQRLSAPCPPVLIVGTDQPEQDWAQCLEMAGLLTDDDRMHPCIHKLFHTGAPLHLDEEGIVTIAEICQSNTEMLVVVDSYAKCTASLGIPEADSLYAAPLMDLQEAIAPSNATLIVIHHSNRAAVGGRASMSSRGTTALPAAVSQTVSLAWANSGDSNPLARQDRRVKLVTEGRAGKPLELLVEQADSGREWILHGSGDQVALEDALQEIIDHLSDRQHEALLDMGRHWVSTGQGMDNVHLAHALGLEGIRPDRKAAEVTRALERKRLLRKEGSRQASGKAGGQPAQLYQPVPEVISLLQKTGLIPL